MVAVFFSKSVLLNLEHHLAAAIKLNNVALYQKIQVLLKIGEGESFSDIADFFSISIESAYQWFKKFSVQGFSWLQRYHYQGRGRRSKLTKAQKDTLYGMIVDGPQANGFDCGMWNAAMISELIFINVRTQCLVIN